MKPLKFLCLLAALAGLCLTASAQQTQTITGTIYDEASKAPLAGVTISVQKSQPAIGTTTDAAGNFHLTGVPIGRQTFKISYMGYEDRMVNDVVVTAGKEVNLNINMQESVKSLKEVTVVAGKAKDKTRTNNDMAQVSARSFNVDETKRYAGALGDPSRMAANFAGVVSGNDARNDIVVRGNSPAGMLWQLEGLNIPNPNHFGSLTSTGGPVSMLNNNNIDKSDFLTSAFPAQYGNALAGVFDIRLRNGNRDKHEFIGQVGFNGFELGAEGPIGKNKQTSYLVNYRYSTLGVFQKLGINFGSGNATPVYQDLNYKIVTNLDKKTKLSLFGIMGNSGIDFLGKDVDTTNTELYNGDPFLNEYSKYGATINGLAIERQLSPRTFTRLTLGYSTTLQQYKADSIDQVNDGHVMPHTDAKFTTAKMSAVWMLMHKFSAKDNLQAGITCDRTGFNLVNKDFDQGAIEDVHINQEGSFGLVQSYAQWKHRFTGSLSAVGGLHFQYLSISSAAAIEPRISFRYAFNTRQAISLGYGLHHQAADVYTYYVQTMTPAGPAHTNEDLGFSRSQHLVLTYDLNISEHMRIKAEAYYQSLDKVPVTQRPSSFSALNTGADFGPSNEDSLVNKGTGYNYGLELTLERFLDHGYYFLVTASLFDSRYKGSDGTERKTAFNTGYVFNVLGGKEFKLGSKGSVLALNLKVSAVGGRNLTPLDLMASQQAGEAKYKDELAFSEKQAAYFRTDFRIAYRKEYRRSTLELALDLQNLTNNKNVFDQSYDRRTGKMVTTYQQGFFPVPTIRYTF